MLPSDDFDDEDNFTLNESLIDIDTETSSDDESSDGESDEVADADSFSSQSEPDADLQSDFGESSVKIHERKRRKLNNQSDSNVIQN